MGERAAENGWPHARQSPAGDLPHASPPSAFNPHLAIVATAMNRDGVSVPVAGWWAPRCSMPCGCAALCVMVVRRRRRAPLETVSTCQRERGRRPWKVRARTPVFFFVSGVSARPSNTPLSRFTLHAPLETMRALAQPVARRWAAASLQRRVATVPRPGVVARRPRDSTAGHAAFDAAPARRVVVVQVRGNDW